MGRDTLLPIAETKYVLDFLILSNSILFHNIGKQAIMHKNNESKSCSIKNLTLQLIQNMQECLYIESFT